MFRVVVEIAKSKEARTEREAANLVAEMLGGSTEYYYWSKKCKPFTLVVGGLRATGKLEEEKEDQVEFTG